MVDEERRPGAVECGVLVWGSCIRTSGTLSRYVGTRGSFRVNESMHAIVGDRPARSLRLAIGYN